MIHDLDNGGTQILTPDSDGDGFADYLDLDSDNDGIKLILLKQAERIQMEMEK